MGRTVWTVSRAQSSIEQTYESVYQGQVNCKWWSAHLITCSHCWRIERDGCPD